MKKLRRPAAQQLRLAAAKWAAALNSGVVDANDSKFLKLDRQLQKAAIRFAKEQ